MPLLFTKHVDLLAGFTIFSIYLILTPHFVLDISECKFNLLSPRSLIKENKFALPYANRNQFLHRDFYPIFQFISLSWYSIFYFSSFTFGSFLMISRCCTEAFLKRSFWNCFRRCYCFIIAPNIYAKKILCDRLLPRKSINSLNFPCNVM